jgi:cytochrome P450
MTLFSEDFRRDPYPTYARMRASSPVVHIAGPDIFLLLSYDAVKRALFDAEAFSSVVGVGETTREWIIFMDPPQHDRLRALIQGAFSRRAVTELAPRIRAISEELLQPHLAGGEFDFVADYAVPLPLRVIAEVLGAPVDDMAKLRAWSDAVLGLALCASGDPRGEAAARAFTKASDEMRAYLAGLVSERKASPREDLVTHLAEASIDGDALGFGELLGFFQLLLVAGHETTTNLISNAVISLTENPGARDRLRADPTLVPGAIEEVLRYRAPVQAAFRETRREVEIGGTIIPAKKRVFAMIGSANRDPDRFAEPDRFDIGRASSPHLAFGHGLHFCIGAQLARLEAQIAFSDLFTGPMSIEALEPTWPPRETFHVHGPSSLRVALRRSDSAPT